MLLLPWLFACDLVDAGNGRSQQQVEGDTAEPPWHQETVPLTVQDLECNSCGGGCEYQRLTYEVRYHTTEDVIYFDPPAVGGPHDYCWIDRGVYPAPVSDERLIHNLEHGDVGILWNCPQGCAAEVEQWVAAAQSVGEAIIVSPNPDLPRRFAIVTWEHRLLLDCVDTAALSAFYAAHQGKAPELKMAGEESPSECGDAYE
jgi:hypothetical protein